MKKFALFFAALVSVLTSCREDIELKIEDTTGVLCVNGFLYADCDTNVLYVTETGLSSPTEINNADVKMYVNGVLKEEVSASDGSGRYFFTEKFMPNDVVKIDVTSNGRHVWREATVPECPKDFSVEVTPAPEKKYYDSYIEDYTTNNMYKIEVSFSDISAGKNYYRLLVDKTSSVTSYDYHHDYFYPDTVYIDGVPYVSQIYKDTTYYEMKTYHGYNERLYLGEAPSLADEEMTATSEFTDGIYNYYKVFNNSRFEGGKCNLRVYDIVHFGSYNNSFPPETKKVRSEEDIEHLPVYSYTQYVGIESIDEDAYYFIKALNGYESGSFDYQELTGSIKMRRNVEGGSGNIVFVSRAVKTIVLYDNYKPTPVYADDDDNNYYYDDYYYNY